MTTDAAYHGGVEIFGYPKSIADIAFELNGSMRSCIWREPSGGKTVLRLSGKVIKTRRQAQERRRDLTTVCFHSYPEKNGTTLHAKMLINLVEYAWSWGDLRPRSKSVTRRRRNGFAA
ncbi:MAG: hypothetical protein M5R36_00455 [Deltaproteobacteria bacterium]|nr:hypothetical protein [Deltaproteobacteria bacterium]